MSGSTDAVFLSIENCLLPEAIERERRLTAMLSDEIERGIQSSARAEKTEAAVTKLREALAGLLASAEVWERLNDPPRFRCHEADSVIHARAALQETKP